MKPLVLCLLSLLFVSADATELPTVTGQVRLPDGQPVVGAQVILVDVADLRRGALVETTTDETGGFAMSLAGFDRLSPQLGRSGLPEGFVLGPNYPNPFNPATVIPYELAAGAHVRLAVFNLLGQRVATLVDGYQAAGSHRAVWTATNAAGQAVSAGVYLYRLTAGGATATGRMVLVDGQAGFGTLSPQRTPTASWAEPVGAYPTDAAYGLVVLRAGVVAYVDADFRVEAGLAPVDVVLEEGRGKRLAGDGWDDLLALFNETVVSSNDGEGNDEGDAEADSSAAVGVDLVVDSLWVDRSELIQEESFTLWVRLRNQGADPFDSTRVDFYLSNNSTISTSDTQMGSAWVDGLAAADTSTVSLDLTAPLRLATHWVGACVEAVSDEDDAENNCSVAVEITVSPVVPSADLVVAATVSTTAPGRSNNIFPVGFSFTLSAKVHNQGTAASDSTMVYYYVSADSTISPVDAAVDSVSVGGLAVAGTSADSLRLYSPSEAGTYYYGACVASVGGESETDNNCSSGVRVIVYKLPTAASSAVAGETEPETERTFSLPGGASLVMIWIRPGTFQMGAPESEPGRWPWEVPVHEVEISKGFWLGKYEVTQGQWEAVMETTPWQENGQDQYYVQSNPSHPAVYISWDDVQEFIEKLNDAAGSSVYRLPTEAEWEYACRAGTQTPWSFGDAESQLTNYAWYGPNALDVDERYAHAVGTKRPNPWGLYDMHGNAEEWVQDWFGKDYYNSSPRVDPQGPTSGSTRVARSGDFGSVAVNVRSALRGGGFPDSRDYKFGVRLLRIR